MRQDDRDGSETEARRILRRIARESEPSGLSGADRAARRVRDHLAAGDADAADGIELWGTRIGRILGLLLTIGLLIWLVAFLFRAG